MGDSSAPHLPDRLPIEDLDNGLYIHQPHSGLTGTPVTQIVCDGAVRYLVSAEEFMEVQRERDNYRRALYLIGSTNPGQPVRRILDGVGIDPQVSSAVGDIVRQVRTGQL